MFPDAFRLPPIVVFPDAFKVLLMVVAPDTVKVPVTELLPVTSRVLLIVVAPATDNVESSVDAPTVRSVPERVVKGKKMPGRMGWVRVTVSNLKVAKVDPENDLLAVEGAVPGRKGTLLEISNSSI